MTNVPVAGGEGAEGALRVMPPVHDELRSIAPAYVKRELPEGMIQITALVNEPYLKLAKCSRVRSQDRVHFFAVSARLMRRILAGPARSARHRKRGGHAERVASTDNLGGDTGKPAGILALDAALDPHARGGGRKSRIVELKFFGGFTTDESPTALDVSPQAVLRDWGLARARLRREIDGGRP